MTDSVARWIRPCIFFLRRATLQTHIRSVCLFAHKWLISRTLRKQSLQTECVGITSLGLDSRSWTTREWKHKHLKWIYPTWLTVESSIIMFGSLHCSKVLQISTKSTRLDLSDDPCCCWAVSQSVGEKYIYQHLWHLIPVTTSTHLLTKHSPSTSITLLGRGHTTHVFTNDFISSKVFTGLQGSWTFCMCSRD